MRSAFCLGLFLALLVANAAAHAQQAPVEFDGLIQKGPTYRAQISYDKEQGWRTVVKLRLPYHHAARIEWINLSEYPILEKPVEHARRQRILFIMESREVVKVPGQERWNTTYRCRVIAVE